jgi:hypothetical protein
MSTQFTEEDIETLDDWNAILGACCCAMPECPVPTKECESITIDALCGFSFPACEGISEQDRCRRFSTRTDSYVRNDLIVDEPSNTERWDVTSNTSAMTIRKMDVGCNEYNHSGTRSHSEVRVVEDNIYNEETDEYEWQHIYTLTYSNLSSYDLETACSGTYSQSVDYVNEPDPEPIVDEEDPSPICEYLDYDESLITCEWTRALLVFTKVEDVTGTSGTGEITKTVTYSDEVIPVDELDGKEFGVDTNGESCISIHGCATATKSRFRWVIPDTHAGTYFKITWDVVFFPTTGDPVAVSTDNTWEWTGPGDPEDEDTWKSGWYEIPVPEEPGENRGVNIRFECYAGPYGHLPQITGEAVEIPPP